MKKTLLIGTLAAVVVAALGLAGLAYAQTPTPAHTSDSLWIHGAGRGRMGSRWNGDDGTAWHRSIRSDA